MKRMQKTAYPMSTSWSRSQFMSGISRTRSWSGSMSRSQYDSWSRSSSYSGSRSQYDSWSRSGRVY